MKYIILAIGLVIIICIYIVILKSFFKGGMPDIDDIPKEGGDEKQNE